MDGANPRMVKLLRWCVTRAGECVSEWTRGGKCGVTAVLTQLSVAVALGKRGWNAELESGERWTTRFDAPTLRCAVHQNTFLLLLCFTAGEE